MFQSEVLFAGKQGRTLRESLTGYAFILPAVTLIFTFGIFPVGFALYVSLQKWRLKRGDFIGLNNYVAAVDNLAFIVIFFLALGGFVLLWITIKKIRRQADEHGESPWVFALPGLAYAATVLSFLRWLIILLPEVLDIAGKVIGIERTQALFFRFLGEALLAESVVPAFGLFVVFFLLSAFAASWTTRRNNNPRRIRYQLQFAISWLAGTVAGLLAWFTWREVGRAYIAAAEIGSELEIWPQVATVGSGVILLVIAWFVWRSSHTQTSDRSFLFRLLVAILFMLGGWLLINELPILLAAGDKDLWSGLKVTIFYSFGTVPFQLAISLFLAVLLFQKMAGSELFRMLYFIPYVTPFVASAAIFRQLFSVRPASPINQILKLFGLKSQQWLQEPTGIFKMLAETFQFDLPAWASGPSLALVVIMIYSIWVYVGYDTVIYVAGLGNISKELMEAAEIDGAGRWEVFRFIVFPLLSPTTYFLSLIAVIGTFKAFSHIWVMRHEFSLRTVDTLSVTIFLEFFDKVRYGYASALAFVLFAIILGLTFINNRIQGARVFYG
ncbi:MAG: sugar ABC transporter permease [Chloroflexi bacterium]|nr:sugar ABC transporter permease [Chloroflexota bacterium]